MQCLYPKDSFGALITFIHLMHKHCNNFLFRVFVSRIILFFSIIGVGCKTTAQPLIPADDTMFIRYYPDLTVFIGTPVPDQALNKDSSAQWANDPFMVDGVLRIKYLVKEWVYGLEKPPDTIEMFSYDHYGAFPFLNSEYALLYVFKNKEGKYIQERYSYYNVYPTTHGGWAGPPNAWRWHRDSVNLKPRIMPYVDSIKIKMHVFEDSTYFPDELEQMEEDYPKPYYYLNKFDMVTMYGHDVRELFNYEKSSLIKQAIFDEKYVDENGEVHFPDDEINLPVDSNDKQQEEEEPKELKLTLNQFKVFGKFYNELVRALKEDDSVILSQLILPEIRVNDSFVNKSDFSKRFIPHIKEYFLKYRRVLNWQKFKEKDWNEWYEIDSERHTILKDSIGSNFKNYWIWPDKKWIMPNLDFQNPQYELYVLEHFDPQRNQQKEFYLHFVLRNGQFFLFGMHFSRMRDCYK